MGRAVLIIVLMLITAWLIGGLLRSEDRGTTWIYVVAAEGGEQMCLMTCETAKVRVPL